MAGLTGAMHVRCGSEPGELISPCVCFVVFLCSCAWMMRLAGAYCACMCVYIVIAVAGGEATPSDRWFCSSSTATLWSTIPRRIDQCPRTPTTACPRGTHVARLLWTILGQIAIGDGWTKNSTGHMCVVSFGTTLSCRKYIPHAVEQSKSKWVYVV